MVFEQLRSKFSNTLEHPHMSNQFKKMHKNKGGDRGRQMGRKNQKPETKDQELDSNDLRMDMREISKRIELLVNKGSGKFHLIPKQSEFSVIRPNSVCIWESSSIFNFSQIVFIFFLAVLNPNSMKI
ncbi:uncharacterized protein LOC112185507 isoform X2 [Rosa chinensis]|uniref:uncharacterized protein LOC112185507 isoform X1 n=1 Tax=Rosa chinensis TaxID=74649 RepID=UPI001AD8D258|nr:uncharacterized protein LOC112185507 isoform X1 [Rosa chinensis]XP_040371259.1 uncharacterized protein LOC112185507 isoform X2 [Rosa chinensis]